MKPVASTSSAARLRAPGRFNPGRFNPGRFNPGRFNPGRFNPGRFNPGRFNPGRFNWGRLVGRLAGLGILVLGTAGCDVLVPGPLEHFLPAPAVVQDHADCTVPSEWRPEYGTPAASTHLMGSVPKGFVPVDVVRCGVPEPHPSADQTTTTWTVTEDHLSGDDTALLAALAEPSDRQEGISCTSDGELLPGLWLVNDKGRAVHVMWPVDACGKARGKPDTAAALEGLKVASSRVLEVKNPYPQGTP